MNEHPETAARPTSADLDLIMGQPIKVLDDGFVRVVDYMGTDDSIVQAARVSYGKGTKRVSEDRGLIRYLMRHRHTTPFEMCEIKFHIRVPMDCWRQWIRHRTANVNEYSTRYSEAIDACQKTQSDQWREQGAANRQGSGQFIETETGEGLSLAESELQDQSRRVYEERLAAGVAREQARKDLPLSTYTEAYWKIDLHNLLHFLSLRMDSHAQLEIRSYANVIGKDIVRRWCPNTWEAFTDYRLDAMLLTAIEKRIIRNLAGGTVDVAKSIAESAGWLKRKGDSLIGNRERDECESKLQELGLDAPWLANRSKQLK